MKVEIELLPFHYNLLTKISEYTDIEINKLCTGIIINHIEDFDSSMMEFLESNLPDSYYNDLYK